MLQRVDDHQLFGSTIRRLIQEGKVLRPKLPRTLGPPQDHPDMLEHALQFHRRALDRLTRRSTPPKINVRQPPTSRRHLHSPHMPSSLRRLSLHSHASVAIPPGNTESSSSATQTRRERRFDCLSTGCRQTSGSIHMLVQPSDRLNTADNIRQPQVGLTPVVYHVPPP